MNTDIFSLVALLILCSGIALLLRQRAAEQSYLFTCAVCCGCFILLLSPLRALISLLKTISQPIDTDHGTILLKAFGIGLATEFGSAVCFDHGQRAFAKQIETAGRIAILLLCAPMLLDIGELIMGMV